MSIKRKCENDCNKPVTVLQFLKNTVCKHPSKKKTRKSVTNAVTPNKISVTVCNT
jgi:hypothetical protein